MNRYLKKSVSLLLAVSVASFGMTGCDTGLEQNEEVVKTSVKADNVNLEALLNSKVVNAEAVEKRETVYVEMDEDGKVTDTTVSDVLSVSGKENISDYSNLSEIVNVDGTEQFAKNNQGELIWENKGKNIKYQGKTTMETPVKVHVKYFLNGEELSAKELAGKSGKVKIVYSYENNAKNEKGKFIPFLFLTGLVLDDNFTNVEVENGKVIGQDGKQIVIGYSVPGFQDYLTDSLDGMESYLDKIELPETVTITADTKAFSSSMAISIATSELGDFNLSDTFDFSDMKGQMNELQNGGTQLETGADTLYNGAGSLQDGTKTLAGGTAQLKDGSEKLYDGTSELLSKYKLFHTGILSGSKDLKDGADELYNGSATLASGAKKAASGAGELASGLKEAKAAFEDTKTTQGLVSGSKALKDGITEVKNGVGEFVQTFSKTPDTIQAQIDGIISQISQATGGAIGKEDALNQTVQGIEAEVKKGTPLDAVLESMGLDTNVYYSLLQAYYSVQTLKSVKGTFEQQITGNAEKIQALTNGLTQLENGGNALSTGINQLYDGVKQLSSGADALSDKKEGLPALEEGADTLKKGLKTLYDGTKSMNSELNVNSPKIKSGIQALNSGAAKVQNGSKELADGADVLDNGVYTLVDGVKELKNGIVQLNDEGISKLTEAFGEKVPEVVDVVDSALNRGKEYHSFSGIHDGMTGSVKFIFKTAEITAE